LIRDRYQLVALIRPQDGPQGTEIFEVIDIAGGSGVDSGTHQIMKVLALEGDGEKDCKRIEFIRRENKALRKINHFAIPKVQRDGFFILPASEVAPEMYCLVQQKIEGQTLDHWLETHGSISQNLALDWLEQLCHCLHEVHRQDFFHRDIKPANIVLQPDGLLVLIDFGAVREMTATYMVKIGSYSQNQSSDPALEVTGIYTIGYAPPEQIEGKTLPQSDFYALGRTFVHLLTGIHPRQLPVDEQSGELVWREQAPQIDKPLVEFLDRLMAIAPGKRPQNTTMLRSYFQQTFYQKKNRIGFLWDRRFQIGIGIGTFLLFAGASGWYQLNKIKGHSQLELTMARGLTSLSYNRASEAQDSFRQVLLENPGNAEAHYYLALACAESQDYDCAIDHHETAIRLAPQVWQHYYALGSLYDDLGGLNTEQNKQDIAKKQYALAENLYRSAHEQSARNDKPLNNLARLALLESRSAEGIKLLQQALPLANQPINKAAIYKNWGWAAMQRKDIKTATHYLERSKALDPSLAATYCLLNQIKSTPENEEACISLPSEQTEVRQWRQGILEKVTQRNR
jgi:serine/threonine protein kinase